MKKKLGEWLLDVSKYIVTVGFIAPFFKNIDEWSVSVAVAMISIVLILLVTGLTLTKEKDNNVKNKRR